MSWYEMLLRLGLATLFGLLVGSEREHRHRPAGIKTHILVCVGAALVSLIQIKMIDEVIEMIGNDAALANALKSDYGRLGAQVISGVGFLGAGTILRNKGTIKGLTTAATLWLIACVGLAVGMGYYQMSIIAIALTMIVLITLHLVQNRLQKGRGFKRIDILMADKREAMNHINDYCTENSIIIQNIELNDIDLYEENISQKLLRYTYSLLLPRTLTIDSVLVNLQMNEHILSASDSPDT